MKFSPNPIITLYLSLFSIVVKSQEQTSKKNNRPDPIRQPSRSIVPVDGCEGKLISPDDHERLLYQRELSFDRFLDEQYNAKNKKSFYANAKYIPPDLPPCFEMSVEDIIIQNSTQLSFENTTKEVREFISETVTQNLRLLYLRGCAPNPVVIDINKERFYTMESINFTDYIDFKETYNTNVIDISGMTFFIHIYNIANMTLSHYEKSSKCFVDNSIYDHATDIMSTVYRYINVKHPSDLDEIIPSEIFSTILYSSIAANQDIYRLARSHNCNDNNIVEIANEITKLNVYYQWSLTTMASRDLPRELDHPTRYIEAVCRDGFISIIMSRKFFSIALFIKENFEYIMQLNHDDRDYVINRFIMTNRKWVSYTRGIDFVLKTKNANKKITQELSRAQQIISRSRAQQIISRLSIQDNYITFYNGIDHELRVNIKGLLYILLLIGSLITLKLRCREGNVKPPAAANDELHSPVDKNKPNTSEKSNNKNNENMLSISDINRHSPQIEEPTAVNPKTKFHKFDKTTTAPDRNHKDAVFVLERYRVFNEIKLFLSTHNSIIILMKRLTSSLNKKILKNTVVVKKAINKKNSFIKQYNEHLTPLDYCHFFDVKQGISAEEINRLYKKVLVSVYVLIRYLIFTNSYFSEYALKSKAMSRPDTETLTRIKSAAKTEIRGITKLSIETNSQSFVHEIAAIHNNIIKLVKVAKKIREKLSKLPDFLIDCHLDVDTFSAETKAKKSYEKRKTPGQSQPKDSKKKSNTPGTSVACIESVSSKTGIDTNQMDNYFIKEGEIDQDIPLVFASIYQDEIKNQPLDVSDILLASNAESNHYKMILLSNFDLINMLLNSAKSFLEGKPMQQHNRFLQLLDLHHDTIFQNIQTQNTQISDPTSAIECLKLIDRAKNDCRDKLHSSDFLTLNKYVNNTVKEDYAQRIEYCSEQIDLQINKYNKSTSGIPTKSIALKTKVVYLFLSACVCINRNVLRSDKNFKPILKQRNQIAHMAFLFMAEANFISLTKMIQSQRASFPQDRFLLIDKEGWQTIILQKKNKAVMTGILKTILQYYSIIQSSVHTRRAAAANPIPKTIDILRCILYELIGKHTNPNSASSYPIAHERLTKHELDTIKDIKSDRSLSIMRYQLFNQVELPTPNCCDRTTPTFNAYGS